MESIESPVGTSTGELQRMADRVGELLTGFESVSTPRQARESAEELVQAIVGLYGTGLARILAVVYETAGERSDEIFEKLIADPFVESLLSLHGLHPIPVEERVAAALDSVRPYLQSHEGGATIVGIDGGVVLLQLEGSCDGCASSTATVKLAVEKAIRDRVPEIHEVRAVGAVPAAAPRATLKRESEWISLDSLRGLSAAPDSGIAAREVEGTPILFVRFCDTVYAYRNACPACSKPLDGAHLARPLVTCNACGFAFDVIHAGRPRGGSGPSAEPFPLAIENGRARVAIPIGA